jgi:FixJ family two-component response regulator/anti-sigma regulatory factor (Ser/Thr protein kinase)
MSHALEAVAGVKPWRVLIVEDDLISRELLRLTLEKKGYGVVPVDCVPDARRQLALNEADHFDCVVTDYLMPGQTGLDLLEYLKESNPALSTIILTADGEKAVVAESLRSGAADFLEKPVSIPRLLTAIERAIQRTRQQRHLRQSDSALKHLGMTQQWMLRSGRVPGARLQVDLCFHPKLDAGGDFLASFQLGPELHCCLLTDVSGHDLQAAYVSAYFHGVFRGMTRCQADLPEIFRHFNDFLVNDWNQADQGQSLGGTAATSLAAVALLFDSRRELVSILICGSPVPVIVEADGRARPLGENGGPPLGWFPEIDSAATVRALNGGGPVYLWTDGLADLAEQHRVHPLCLAFAMQQAKRQGTKHPLLDHARDDLLFAQINFSSEGRGAEAFQPLLIEEYGGDQADQIDVLTESWRRNLLLAFPQLGDTAEHDLVLIAREALLNALEHGCGGDAGRRVRFQISTGQGRDRLRLWVEDPGQGHAFDRVTHVKSMDDELIDQHRGLMLIHHLAQSVRYERNGATVIIDYQL